MNERAEELTSNDEQSVTNSWLSTLPAELQKAESLGKFKDVTTLASSYLELEKSLNSRIAIPKPEAAN